ncbi:hypothetical protein GCM10010123_34140 [Pilimelia anulata]|uniref:Uncharacterized protein n=1 Tax=Pilimelia anulata TaxID=53371 RepID=A0A8J3B8N2_9ACTN|nr:hypothetical protein [Pilimelia anulata]GGK01354.1 hypothetical protein GCM10010123_34140 [Pilimelia anulata]
MSAEVPTSDGAPTSDGVPLPARPTATLTAAVWLLYGEAVAVTLVAGWLLWADLSRAAASVAGALLVTAFAIAGAALLWYLARALAAGRGGGRGLAVVLQFMFLSIGYYMSTGGLPAVGAAVLGYAGSAAVLLCLPPTTRALGLDRRS